VNLTPSTEAPAPSTGSSVELLWIPLGAGQRIVKHSGKAFESICALIERRPVCDIYHAALVITVPDGRYTIEMAPIPDRQGARRGVVAEGPVGLKMLGRFRIFRYEIRSWHGGLASHQRQPRYRQSSNHHYTGVRQAGTAGS
jgi:hypothetical protein